MCVGDFPVAVVPLWQLEQLPLTLLWSSDVTAQLLVPWQASQLALVAICVGDLPVAADPLWQLAQVPVAAVWSILASGVQADVV